MTDPRSPARRRLLGGVPATLLAALLPTMPLWRAGPAMAEVLKLSVGVGLVNDGAPLVYEIQKDKLLEQAAKELGIALEAEYLNFTVLLRMLQGIAAGQLQFGQLGSTPAIRMLATDQPAIPIALAGGGATFPLQVPPGSPIKTLADLRGKTILTIIGSDLHLQLLLMLQAEFGTDDVKELGITVRNIQSLTELGRAQSGIDAVLSLEPLASFAQAAGALVTLARNDGSTGPAWAGPEGKGEGHQVASFAKTPFYPEAYYPHRIWWVVREDFLKANPDAVTALLVANARAADVASKLPLEQLVAFSNKEWLGDPPAQTIFAERFLWRRRGWTWITEGDARTLVGLSRVKGIFQSELTAQRVTSLMALGGPVARRAWEHVGKAPAREAFTDAKAADIRGLPQWESERWTLA